MGLASERMSGRFKSEMPDVEDRETVQAAPLRTIANAVINGWWRNGPIESVHAGRSDTPGTLRLRPALSRCWHQIGEFESQTDPVHDGSPQE